MTTIKYPLSLNDNDQERIKELTDLLGITGVYGDVPKALKFSINLALSVIKNPEKVYNDLKDSEMQVLFSSIHRAEVKARKLEKAEKLKKTAEKV